MHVTIEQSHPAPDVPHPQASDPVTHQLHAFLLSLTGKYDHGVEVNGAGARPSDALLERHLNARGDAANLLPQLRRRTVAEHRAGDQTLYVSPKRDAVRREPALLFCYASPPAPTRPKRNGRSTCSTRRSTKGVCTGSSGGRRFTPGRW